MAQQRAILVVLFSVTLMWSNGIVQGRRNGSINNKKSAMNERASKTIKSKFGDVIDCVDIYKQPAFDHPLLINHTLQMEPSSYPTRLEHQEQNEFIQTWNDDEECPEGTIPIRRTTPLTQDSLQSIATKKTRLNSSLLGPLERQQHEHVIVSESGGQYTGAQASISIWNPKTEIAGELSLSQMWILGGTGEGLNSIEAGWIVLASLYQDTRTRFFVYWTSDNYQSTGCYDLRCPGFVQTDKTVVLGGVLEQVSTYNGETFEMTIAVFKDPKSGNWWLKFGQIVVGYWPRELYRSLADSASLVEWGGEILNTRANGHHTTTQMGSGHFPSEGNGRSSFIHNLKVQDGTNLRDPVNLQMTAESPSCYGGLNTNQNTFYYGGPGYSAQCP